MPDEYFIRDGYAARHDPAYDIRSPDDDIVWQPDVYPEAARIAKSLGASCIVDIGSGDGAKLAALHPRFDLIGLDLPGPNLDHCRAAYPYVEWLVHDAEGLEALPVPDQVLARSVVVCCDVIEHLLRPDRLLRTLRGVLDVAPAITLSTPARDLTWGDEHLGPPPNPSHVREWATEELAALLDEFGFLHRSITLTRSNDRLNERKTILCELFRDKAAVHTAA